MKKYKITKIYVSELGYLMVEILDKDRNHFTSYNTGSVESIIDFEKINIPPNQIENVKRR